MRAGCARRGALPLLAALVVTVACLFPSLSRASWGEKYLAAQVDYRPVLQAEAMLHTPALTLGGGYHVSDFALVEGSLFYGATYGDGAFRQLWGVDTTLRLLIDATQWIPSVGPAVGYLFGYDTQDSFQHGFYLGASACLDYRTWRTHSFEVCGEVAVFPFQKDYTALYLIGFRANGFLPYLFD